MGEARTAEHLSDVCRLTSRICQHEVSGFGHPLPHPSQVLTRHVNDDWTIVVDRDSMKRFVRTKTGSGEHQHSQKQLASALQSHTRNSALAKWEEYTFGSEAEAAGRQNNSSRSDLDVFYVAIVSRCQFELQFSACVARVSLISGATFLLGHLSVDESPAHGGIVVGGVEMYPARCQVAVEVADDVPQPTTGGFGGQVGERVIQHLQPADFLKAAQNGLLFRCRADEFLFRFHP